MGACIMTGNLFIPIETIISACDILSSASIIFMVSSRKGEDRKYKYIKIIREENEGEKKMKKKRRRRSRSKQAWRMKRTRRIISKIRTYFHIFLLTFTQIKTTLYNVHCIPLIGVANRGKTSKGAFVVKERKHQKRF